MKMSKVLVLIALMATVAEAGARCHYTHVDYKTPMYRNNVRVDQLQAAIVATEKEIALTKTALPGWEHGKMSCSKMGSALNEALTAVNFAVGMIESAVVNISYFEEALAQLDAKNNDASVSEMLRNYANSWNLLWPSQRQALLEFAKVIDVLAAKDEAWKKSEKEWIKSYLDLQKPSVEDYIVRLKNQREDLAYRITEAERSCQESTDQAQRLNELLVKKAQEIEAMKAEQTQLSLKNRELHAAKKEQEALASLCADDGPIWIQRISR